MTVGSDQRKKATARRHQLMVSSSISARNGPRHISVCRGGAFSCRMKIAVEMSVLHSHRVQPRAGFRVGQQVPSERAEQMPRYFFDTMDSGRFISDESGIELPSIQAARAEAARSLADIAGHPHTRHKG